MSKLKELIEQNYTELHKNLDKLVCDEGKIKVSSFGNIRRFKTMEDAELYAKYSFPNEDYYSIYDDTYALAE